MSRPYRARVHDRRLRCPGSTLPAPLPRGADRVLGASATDARRRRRRSDPRASVRRRRADVADAAAGRRPGAAARRGDRADRPRSLASEPQGGDLGRGAEHRDRRALLGRRDVGHVDGERLQAVRCSRRCCCSRAASGSERRTPTAAIENSDNAAGYRLFLDAGGNAGIEPASQRFGMNHTVPGASDPTFTTHQRARLPEAAASNLVGRAARSRRPRATTCSA